MALKLFAYAVHVLLCAAAATIFLRSHAFVHFVNTLQLLRSYYSSMHALPTNQYSFTQIPLNHDLQRRIPSIILFYPAIISLSLIVSISERRQMQRRVSLT